MIEYNTLEQFGTTNDHRIGIDWLGQIYINLFVSIFAINGWVVLIMPIPTNTYNFQCINVTDMAKM